MTSQIGLRNQRGTLTHKIWDRGREGGEEGVESFQERQAEGQLGS